MMSFSIVMFAFATLCLVVVLWHNSRRTNAPLGAVITLVQVFGILIVAPVAFAAVTGILKSAKRAGVYQ